MVVYLKKTCDMYSSKIIWTTVLVCLIEINNSKRLLLDCIEESRVYLLLYSTEESHLEMLIFWGELSKLFHSDAVAKQMHATCLPSLSLTPRNMTTVQTRNSPPITPAAIMYTSFCKEKQTVRGDGKQSCQHI